MNRIRIILTAASLMLLVASCNKDKPSVYSTEDIRFGMHISGSTPAKAVLESSDLLTSGTQIKVYGFAENEDITGHRSDGTEGTSTLNEGHILEYGSDRWEFTDNGNETYRWLYRKTHKFFGWLTLDKKSDIAASDFFTGGFSFNQSTKVLSISSKEMGINPDNLDFAYSDIVTRDAASADYSTVDLSLRHLFACFGLSARNYSSKAVTIKKIAVHGLVDSKNATINYSGDAASVTYAGGSVINRTLYSSTTGFTLAAAGSAGDTKANVVGTPADDAAYFLVWPQTKLGMTYTGTEEEGRPAPAVGESDQPYLEISYSQDGSDITAYALIPHDTEDPDGWGWAPGVRHEMEISFHDKEMDLGFKAAYWDKIEPVIDFNGAVNVKEKLKLAPEFYNNCTLSKDAEGNTTAYFKPGIPIVLQFSIGTPANATWIVGKKLDWDSFDVYNYPDGARKTDEDIITAEGIVDGNTVRIAIDPPRGALQKNEYSLKLTFIVRLNNGDTVNLADSDIYEDGCPTTFIYIKQ